MDTTHPHRVYWSLVDQPCHTGTPGQHEGASVHRWSWFHYVQLAVDEIVIEPTEYTGTSESASPTETTQEVPRSVNW
ncbi:hypothetical protein BD410DRAFT_796510 [Rickenella mellea]|uniref:Uncharacterized protein n=1 Tax=Rickenella mellea TaxID=50990 RepID=A0A4Y7PJ99_9AGAM|nr:hypothetical protein BD410DRAFT_796510 [Rickenella mellea]